MARILVVDDELMMLSLLRTILIRLDGAVVSAQARQLWQAHRSKRRSASRQAVVRVTPLTRTRRATA